MARLSSGMMKVAFFVVVALPVLVGGCVDNVWASAATTAVDTGVVAIVGTIAQAIADRIVPVTQ